MDWLNSVFIEHSALQAVVILSTIIAMGLALAKIHIFGVSLGVTWVFFAGILAGHLGLSIDAEMLSYAESFGLVLFVYELGLKVGPGFFSSFRRGGVKLNMLGMGVVLLGTLMAVAFTYTLNVPMADMVGILAGATTNTPSLGAAQQTLQQLGQPVSGAALSCAVTYPLGVVGVILAIIIIRRLAVKPRDLDSGDHDNDNRTFIAAYQVHNPAIFGLSIQQAAQLTTTKFVISRLWRDHVVTIPGPDTQLLEGDRLLVVTGTDDRQALTVLFGEQEKTDWNKDNIDWDAIDRSLTSRHVYVSRPEINGRRLGSLRLRNTYGINISRVLRSGVKLLATPQLILQLGDRLTIVGEAAAIDNVEKVLGGTSSRLKDPNLAVIFVGIVLGLLLGTIPISVPGVSTPVKLGLAGGPIIIGILMGRFGPNFKMVTYTTRSANLMLRGIGLSLFLACLGLNAGEHFLETIMCADGLKWIILGFILTLLPSLIMIYISMRRSRLDFGSACGMVSGAMANPMAMDYATGTIEGDNTAVAYATVYPLAMFSRVVIAQLLVLFFC
jgi:AspT/YidE/YbjL antiporter-like protein